MTRYRAKAITTRYWKPGTDWLAEVVKCTSERLRDGDFIVLSEKAVSTASGNIVDEEVVKPSSAARFLAVFWMRFVWGYLLGFLCGYGRNLISILRGYPSDAGSRHKQVALRNGGILQALMFGSEGGIDGSNLPFSFVSLPLSDAHEIAEKVAKRVESSLEKKVVVVIVDTDKTYSFGGFHFTPRPKPIKGVHSFGGVFAYLVGHVLRLKRRATPIAVAGGFLSVEGFLQIAELANHVRGFGSGRTVWEMAKRFHVGLSDVTWEMLETVRHKPIVIVRGRR
jgi:F420-0:gamma-glutamyl ligase-like protein